MSTLSKILTGTVLAASLLATASSANAAYSYGGVKFYGPAYSYQGHSGQSGNVTYFGAPPTFLPSHNGQYGGVTFLGGVQPYTYPSHNGQYGNVTYFGYRPAGTVPVHTVTRPDIIRIWPKR